MTKKLGLFMIIWSGLTIPVLAVSIIPSLQFFNVKPGEKAKGEYQITNNEDEDIKLVPGTKEWFVAPENKNIQVEDWLKFEKEKIPIKKGQTKKFKFSVVGSTVAKGELMGMISFLIEGEHASNINKRLSVAVYMGIKGTEKIDSEVLSMMLDASTTPATAGIIFQNNGNVHLRPVGVFQILKSEEEVVANFMLDERQPTFPGRSRGYYGTLEGLNLEPGDYTARILLKDVDRMIDLPSIEKKFSLNSEKKMEIKK